MTKQLKIDKMKKREAKYVPGLYTSAHDQMVIEKNEVFEPSTLQRPKFLGKIDLDSIPTSVRPVVHEQEPVGFIESVIDVTDREEMVRRIGEWQPDWHQKRIELQNSNLSPYKDGEVLQFEHDGHKGIAIGCLDPIKNIAGYYIAAGLYGEGVLTTMSEKVMEDGAVAGEWPVGMRYVNKANESQVQMANMFMLPQIQHQREAYRELLVVELLELAEEQKRRAEELQKAEAEKMEREKQEAVARLREQREELQREDDGKYDDYPMTLPPEELPHIPFVTHQKSVRDSDWPRVDAEIKQVRYYDGMKTLCYIIDESMPMPTYILSRAYIREMNRQRDELMKNYVSYRQLLNGETRRRGVLCYNVAGTEVTVIFDIIAPEEGSKEFLRFAVINDDQLICTYNFYRPNTAVSPYVTHLSMIAPIDPRYSKMKDICNRTIEKIILHVMMEQQTEALTQSESAGPGDSGKSGEPAPGIFFRTAEWYARYKTSQNHE